MLGLCWGRREQTLSGKWQSEETREGLLACRVEKLRLNPNSSSVHDCFDVFLVSHRHHAPTLRTFMAPVCKMTQPSWYGATSIPLYAQLGMVSWYAQRCVSQR